MKRTASLLGLMLVFSTAPPARADKLTGAVCGDAYARAQQLRNDRKLLQARDALRICAQPTCKDFIIKDCTSWLDQVQASLPTVVPVAADETGTPLAGVKVSMDGQVLLEKVEGRSVEVDPGAHTFTFERPDGTKMDKAVIVPEGERDRRVLATFPSPRAPSTATMGPPPVGSPSLSTSSAGDERARGGFPWRTAGLVTAGVGVAAIGVGTLFGVEAMSKKSDAGCNADSQCQSEVAATKLRDAQSAGNAATVFFVVGGVLTAGGIVIWSVSPRHVTVAPSVGRGSAGLAVGGAF